MRLSQFNYNLPQNLIAQKPTAKRDRCQLLVTYKDSDKIEHLKFFEIEKFLKKGDVIILNDSKVIPARLYGKKSTGGQIEMLLIKKINSNSWEILLKNFKQNEINKKIIINNNFFALPIKHIENGLWLIKFNVIQNQQILI